MNVYLVGYRGAGKTTVASLVAKILGRPSIDLDAALERRAGRTIRKIFEEDGEAAFRSLEADELIRADAFDDVVVATGGGIVLRPSNRDLLRRGFVAWLSAPAEVLWERIARDPDRPRLTTLDPQHEVVRLLAEREPLYREIAAIEIDAASSGPLEIAEQIVATFRATRE
jgi:shikimate kinase